MGDTGLQSSHVEALEARLAEQLQKLDEVKSLLAKADTRLREEPDQRRRWQDVIDKLELSLTEIRARCEHTELELKFARGQSSSPPLQRTEFTGNVSDSGIRFVNSMMDLSPASISGLSLEEIAQAHAHGTSTRLSTGERALYEARLETANQVRAAAPSQDDTELPSRRTQLTLRAAIDKIQTGRIESMSPDEVRLTLSCYELMARRVNPTPSDLRLKRILGGALNILQRRQQREVLPR